MGGVHTPAPLDRNSPVWKAHGTGKYEITHAHQMKSQNQPSYK